MIRTYEYKLKPTRKQNDLLWKFLKGTRYVYNAGLEELNDYYKKTGSYMTYFTQDRLHDKKRWPELPAVLVDTSLQRLHNTFKLFFNAKKAGRKVGHPRFKSWRSWVSFEFRDATQHIEGNEFKGGHQLGRIKIKRMDRPLAGEFVKARIVQRPSGWYLQCVTELPDDVLPPLDKAVGLDVGIKHLVADSDGNVVENPNNLKKSLSKLRRLQRALARKTLGSVRRKKAARRVARLHEHIHNQRKDTLHKISRKYVNENGTIVVEDLNIRGMVRNHCLARSISDSSWGMLIGQIAYKAESADRRFVQINPRYTSQKCSKCGEYVEKSLSVRTHVCPSCGLVEDRDINAAKNILRAGLALQVVTEATASVA